MVEGSGVDLIVVLSERAWSSSKFFIRQAPWRMRPFYRVLGAGLMARAARLDACAPAPHLADFVGAASTSLAGATRAAAILHTDARCSRVPQ